LTLDNGSLIGTEVTLLGEDPEQSRPAGRASSKQAVNQPPCTRRKAQLLEHPLGDRARVAASAFATHRYQRVGSTSFSSGHGPGKEDVGGTAEDHSKVVLRV
jgi:hypothetical protein